LKNYEWQENQIKSLTKRLAIIESIMTSPRVASCSSAPVHGGGNRYEDNLLGYIDKCDEIKKQLARGKARIAIIDSALEVLGNEELRVLERFFVHKSAEPIRDLCAELNYERTKIYGLRKAALRKYVAVRYCVEI
jgi:hypothetical protein